MLNLRNKLGQLLIMGFSGSEIHNDSPIAQWLINDGLGGVILFDKDLTSGQYGKNLVNKLQITELVNKLKCYAEQGQFPSSLLTAIDYEGGAVDRLKSTENSPETLQANELSALTPQCYKEQVEKMAYTLESLGFNLNFAPVVDLNLNEQEGIIGTLGRSFSSNVDEVVRCAKSFVDIFNQHGIACCFKHFPGHGSATGDTHLGFVDVTDTFKLEELGPYSQLLKEQNQAVMIMTAHVINRTLDSQGLPATLSKPILTGLLRKTMEYDGIIISDDLQMHAIANHYSLEESLCLTFEAGADMVIFGNQLGYISAPEVINCMEQLVLNNRIELSRIEESYKRVLLLKQQITSHSRADCVF